MHRQGCAFSYGVCVRLSRVRVKNFRNLADIDVPLAQHTVIVGENRSGKSNLLHAMRLVLDSTLSTDQLAAPSTEESFTDSRHRLYDGRALAVVRPTGEGLVTVTASAADLPPTAVEIEIG